ncbi:hypothetical protein SAMN04489760_1364 [Syntrophus gentianae]|uniref:Uncharacterized protein n=1 Tax=Syntrophus gentianae TaxID=43775 RepID=A0A1H8AGX4_9BACT|nr:hypothetical protein [Syntrophus gentianae]SEM70062.1 hypothetical protein SAMN04489760_1364 [Syntrophus gentianae]
MFVGFCLMSQEYDKEKSPDKEQQKELFNSQNQQDQADILSDYEFFLSERDVSKEKETGENQEGELMDFFLSK